MSIAAYRANDSIPLLHLQLRLMETLPWPHPPGGRRSSTAVQLDPASIHAV